MKVLLRRLVTRAVRSDRVWAVLDATILKFSRYAAWARRNVVTAAAGAAAIGAISPDLTVLHGPFRGMRYPQAESWGNLFPKLLGSYERELHPTLETICAVPYTEIVDVGSAEGYYAVGLALRIPTARVFAYDIDPDAIASCRRMADLNGVGERLVTGGFCGPDTLKSVPFTDRGLVVSDCEGYERELFTDDVVPFLAGHDLLIELHDYVDIGISTAIRRRFEGTHLVTAISSVDDVTKAHTYCYEELRGYDLASRMLLLGEERATAMEWFYLTPLADGERNTAPPCADAEVLGDVAPVATGTAATP